MDLDLCPKCDMPTFNTDEICLINNEFYHRYCVEDSVMVVKQENLRRIPIPKS